MSDTSTVPQMRTARPRVDPAVRIGPGLWDGDRRLYTLHDPRTGWYFRIGEHEHFLTSRMDGERTVEEIEDEFIAHFRKRLTPALWQSMFTLLGQRGLLVGSDDPVLMARLRDARDSQSERSRTWLHARLPLVRPERLLDRLAAVVRPLDRPVSWALVWLAAAAAICYTALLWNDVWPQARTLWTEPAAMIVFVVIAWTSLFLHELGHGVVAKLYGARDIEIGFMWRLPVIAAYCKVDDSLLFHDRMRRVRVAFAGVTVSVAVSAPFAPLHWITAGEGMWGTVSAAMLTFGMFSGLMNLLPVFRLDGYYVLSHLLDVSALDESARRELVRLVRRGGAPAVPGPKRRVYLAYGIGAYLFLTALVAAMAAFAYFGITPYVGAGAAVALIATAILLAFVLGVIMTRRSRRKMSALPGTQAPDHSKWGQT
ncbi:putative peptide zinc metalloprotease protein [Stackebrandtia albiflava]|uniref:Putative peptide zinc metalloprotease protein n=1 Tax=Stackebrandtia albiflava TaxID=406432 RepID=A0A562VC02_9ACTN|nr:M50 family metallopeptidase [Stackebrandtia albiflava]TWJ15388.1 putative peptide zinc metalloprotease protein [Stackebrandtia albiflava]